MYRDRLRFYQELEQARNSKVIAYITGDRPGLETQIHQDVIDYFVNHLDLFGKAENISLYLYTRGGSTLAAWTLVNLIRQFCDIYEVIVPLKAHSAGTLLCLGADSILMTKQASLGPIDPSVNTPLNPQIPGGAPNAKVPVSVEAIKGYLELATDELKIQDKNNLTKIVLKLADMVHPLVLGEVYRAREQIRMIARKLLIKQLKNERQIKNIISFLCSDSGSHDYTIDRTEARDTLGLKIDKPDDRLYSLIKSIFDDIQAELELNKPYDPNYIIGNNQQSPYTFRRALIESVVGGSDVLISEGVLTRNQIQIPGIVQQIALEDKRLFEGWRHENV